MDDPKSRSAESARRQGAKRIARSSLNFIGAIASIVALALFFAQEYIPTPVGVTLGLVCAIGISIYLAYVGKVILERTSTALLARVGDEQKKAISDIQKNFSDELATTTTELAAKSTALTETLRAIEEMSRLSLRIRRLELEADKDENPKELVRNLLRHNLIELASLFRTMSGADCRVCVKMIYTHVDKTGAKQRAVKAIVRSDTINSDSREYPDRVDQNTDFNAILINREKYWFSGNIHDRSRLRIYSNTSPSYSYSSVIVWPLRTFEAGSSEDGDRPKDKLGDVIGFLCLDSEVVDAFSRDREVIIGWWFVDTLAGVVDQLLKKKLINV